MIVKVALNDTQELKNHTNKFIQNNNLTSCIRVVLRPWFGVFWVSDSKTSIIGVFGVVNEWSNCVINIVDFNVKLDFNLENTHD